MPSLLVYIPVLLYTCSWGFNHKALSTFVVSLSLSKSSCFYHFLFLPLLLTSLRYQTRCPIECFIFCICLGVFSSHNLYFSITYIFYKLKFKTNIMIRHKLNTFVKNSSWKNQYFLLHLIYRMSVLFTSSAAGLIPLVRSFTTNVCFLFFN